VTEGPRDIGLKDVERNWSQEQRRHIECRRRRVHGECAAAFAGIYLAVDMRHARHAAGRVDGDVLEAPAHRIWTTPAERLSPAHVEVTQPAARVELGQPGTQFR